MSYAANTLNGIGYRIPKGNVPWNKGLHTMTEAQKERLRRHFTDSPISFWLGKRRPSPSISTRKKMSESHMGERAPNWKGGVTKENHKIRSGLEYRLWRESVFKRDDWTCVWCGVRGVELNADHIKPFAYFQELRFAIDNGRTLCVPCHKTTGTYLRNIHV